MSEDNKIPLYNDPIGDILKSYSKEGGMENLKGQGKPLPKEYFSGDTFQRFQKIANDAGYKPHWLKLQHEIKEQLHMISAIKTQGQSSELTDLVNAVNEKINEHNKHCPPPMFKGRVTLDSVDRVINLWK
ncbi:DUF1992 domain-containing protein [Sporosarcina sp. Sa2YVA2]|uniref:DUF1992 domain-containing protein n=1 Tax=Sporosarcina quadrami TaxID=2762234 RepID=A0ABR8U8W0_9BACL|nr:DnaJ family domain-containing protein [Sporosarcina quadrami]MBD7984455.1 DUF1992 domain-containing protein [Sporosarcina quadrami]